MTEARNIVVWVLNIVMGVVLFFIGLRILLRLVGANPQTPFVSWIYDTSGFFMTPFEGIFPQATARTGAVVDITAIVALVIYAALVYIAIAIVNAAYRTALRTEDHIEAHDHVDRHR